METLWHQPQNQFLIALAPHGGDIEAYTDQIAVELYKNMPEGSCSMWAFHGFGDNAFAQYHVTSNKITEEQFPKLGEISSVGFQNAISFHVKNKAEKIEVGGLAHKKVRDTVAEVIEDAVNGKWSTVTDHSKGTYMAVSSKNIVNRLTHDRESGIQVELPINAARNYRKRIARNLADLYSRILKN